MFDKRLMQMCPESRKYIVGNVLLQWLELMMNACMIWLIANAFQHLYEKTWTLSVLWKPVILILVTVGVRFLTTRGATHMSYMASRTVKRVMREQIYAKLLKLGTSYREHAETAELVQESVEGVDQLESYFGQYVPQFFYAFLAPITLFFLFGLAGSWQAAAVLMICVPLIPGAIMMVQKIAKKLLAKYWGQYTQLGSTFLENLQGMTTLKTYQADAYKNEQMNRESEHFRLVTMKVLTMQLNSIIIMDFVAYGGAAIGIVLAVKSFLNGQIGLAPCLFMILLSADFFLPMRRLGSFFHVAMNGMAASDKIFRFLGEPEPEEKTEMLPFDAGDVVLQNVHFSYTPEREILHGVSMQIPKGGRIGIVGESGSGKSTIASLLMGRNTVDAGDITIAGIPIDMVEEKNLLKTITYVGLGSTLFKGAVRENLQLADPKASEDRMYEVLSECGMADFFREKEGLDTQLLENAGNLSGGQRQRLALARALLHDSPIYIFDEATSNIDVDSEEAVLKEIRNLAKKKTVIMITHRLANVTGADRIYCLQDGNLAESGSHEELLQKDGVYAKLWQTQQALETFGREAKI